MFDSFFTDTPEHLKCSVAEGIALIVCGVLAFPALWLVWAVLS